MESVVSQSIPFFLFWALYLCVYRTPHLLITCINYLAAVWTLIPSLPKLSENQDFPGEHSHYCSIVLLSQFTETSYKSAASNLAYGLKTNTLADTSRQNEVSISWGSKTTEIWFEPLHTSVVWYKRHGTLYLNFTHLFFFFLLSIMFFLHSWGLQWTPSVAIRHSQANSLATLVHDYSMKWNECGCTGAEGAQKQAIDNCILLQWQVLVFCVLPWTNHPNYHFHMQLQGQRNTDSTLLLYT